MHDSKAAPKGREDVLVLSSVRQPSFTGMWQCPNTQFPYISEPGDRRGPQGNRNPNSNFTKAEAIDLGMPTALPKARGKNSKKYKAMHLCGIWADIIDRAAVRQPRTFVRYKMNPLLGRDSPMLPTLVGCWKYCINSN